jgi:hypothetical protein
MLGYNMRDCAASSNAPDHFRVCFCLLIQTFVLTKANVFRYEKAQGSDSELGIVETTET